MTDKKPDVDEFNFDQKTEKSNVLDQSMTTSRTSNSLNPAAAVLAAVFFVGLVYFFWGGSSSVKSTESIAKKVIDKVEGVKKPAPIAPPTLSKDIEISASELEKELVEPQVAPPEQPVKEAPAQPAPIEPTASLVTENEYRQSMDHIEHILKQLYERQADISSQIHHHMVASDKMLQKNYNEIKMIINQLGQDNQEIHKKQAHIEKSIGGIAHQISESNEAMKNIEKVMRVQLQEFQVSPHDLAEPLPAPKYSLHAVIPGRAWLKQGNHIFSVSEGQELEPYGRILTIDARQGTIVTSSGQVIRYT